MGVLWLLCLFLPLAARILPCLSLQAQDWKACPESLKPKTRQSRTIPPLTYCTNDYFSSITCEWNSSGRLPREHCDLQGVLYTRRTDHVKRCDLKLMEGQDTLRSCHLNFTDIWDFNHRDRVLITVKCGNYTDYQYEYKPCLCVKMHPPVKPIVVKSNISWSLGSPHSRQIPSYVFELQFKGSEQPWQNAVSFNLSAQQTSAELPEDELEKGWLYEARVRVKLSSPHALNGVWSSWSPTASWRSEVGRSPERGPGPHLQVTLVLVTAAVALLGLITCKFHRAGWVSNWKLHHVPNPSTYFQSLHSVHGGNFQKWLNLKFDPELFDVPQSLEDISSVEVFKGKDVATLFYHKHASDPTEQCDSSSKHPSTYSLEVCPVYSSLKSAVVLSGEEGGKEGVEIENAPLRVICSDGQLGGGSAQLDPGCREQNEYKMEEEEEGEIVNGPNVIDALPPLTILACTPLIPATPCLPPIPPHLPRTPLLPFPFHDIDSDIAPGSCNNLGPLEGAFGSPFAKLEPSTGDYMSVPSAGCYDTL